MRQSSINVTLTELFFMNFNSLNG